MPSGAKATEETARVCPPKVAVPVEKQRQLIAATIIPAASTTATIRTA
jgi:hypothetical protein